jgi:hypothetical protein
MDRQWTYLVFGYYPYWWSGAQQVILWSTNSKRMHAYVNDIDSNCSVRILVYRWVMLPYICNPLGLLSSVQVIIFLTAYITLRKKPIRHMHQWWSILKVTILLKFLPTTNTRTTCTKFKKHHERKLTQNFTLIMHTKSLKNCTKHN